MIPKSNKKLILSLHLFSKLGGISIILLGVSVLVGWFTGNIVLKTVIPEFPTMKCSTSILFILSGLIVCFSGFSRFKKIFTLNSILISLFGFLTLSQYLFSIYLGIDRLFLFDELNSPYPGRMSPMTAFNFFLIGIALTILLKKRKSLLIDYLVLFVLVDSFAVILGYLYGLDPKGEYLVITYSHMAIHSSLGFVILSISILFSKPTFGIMKSFTSSSLGALATRHLLLPSILIPLVLGWLRIQGEKFGYFDSVYGLTLFSISMIVIFTLLILRNAILLNQINLNRMKSEKELSELRNMREKEIERNLNKSEEKWQSLFKILPVGISIVGKDSRIKELNHTMEKNLEISREDILARKHNDRIYLNSNGIPILAQEFPSSVAIREQREVKNVEIGIIKEDGSKIWLEVSASPLHFSDDEACVTVTTDITELKEKEIELQNLTEALVQANRMLKQTNRVAKIGGWEFDRKVNLMHWSKIMREILELPTNFIPDLSSLIDFLIDVESKYKIASAFHVAFEFGVPWDEEFEIITKTGKRLWVRVLAETELENGKCIRIFGTLQDISDSKKVESALRNAKELAESANKTKSEFLAVISHEMKTPLTGIIGFSDMLLSTKLDALQIEFLRATNQSANSLLDLINDILDFSKIESKKILLNLEAVNIVDFLNQIANLIQIIADKKNLKFIFNISSELPKTIFLDSIRLRQVLVNLLDNAVKFTEKGEVEFSIELLGKNELTDEVELLFSVKDTGIGIDSAYSEKIFSAFSQVDYSLTRKYGGTGLGLSISNRTLDLMKSKLEFKSELRKGSNFYFKIIAKIETKVIASRDRNLIEDIQESLSREDSSQQLNPYRVLIVDDDPLNVFLEKSILKKFLPNCIFIEAADGKEAVKMFTKSHPDIILMDIQMPEMNGYEATKIIRSLEKTFHTPILAITAGTKNQDECFEAGMDAFMTKPIDINLLERNILKWLAI